MLRVKKLSVSLGGKEIIRDIEFSIEEGEVYALLGPNASGKSTLLKVIMGIGKYKVKGRIYFLGKDITKLKPEQRSELGIALAFQHPVTIKGVTCKELLKSISKLGYESLLEEAGIERLLNRELNAGFSGGEKKLFELVQVIALKPKLAMLDEIDSGLDVKRLKLAGKLINEHLLSNNASVLLVTHHGEILKHVKRVDRVGVLLNGKLICESRDWKRVFKTIRRWGYEKCKRCELLTS